jgi:hypothetical protein
MRPVVRKRITVIADSAKILEDSGSAEDLGANKPAKFPQGLNPPRKYSFLRIHIQDLLRMGFTGPVRYGPMMPVPHLRDS